MGRVFAACVSPVTAVVLAFLTLALPFGAFARRKRGDKAGIAAAQQPETQPRLTQPLRERGRFAVCALKSWIACVLYDAAPACKAPRAGRLPPEKPATDDKQVATKPWSAPFDA